MLPRRGAVGIGLQSDRSEKCLLRVCISRLVQSLVHRIAGIAGKWGCSGSVNRLRQDDGIRWQSGFSALPHKADFPA